MTENTPPTNLRRQAIHRHSFWLYSVIVGLSLEEVLRHVLPRIYFVLHNQSQLYITLEFCRLAIFLTLIVRFYLGSVSFFNKAHAGEVSLDRQRNKSYTNDFFFGLIHFSAFYGLGISIDASTFSENVVWYLPNMFLGWLSFILFYDVIWLVICWRYKTKFHVLPWAAINFANLVLSGFFYFVARGIAAGNGATVPVQQFWAEVAFLIPVLLVSIFDILEVFDEQPRIANAIRKVFPVTRDDPDNEQEVSLLDPEMNEPGPNEAG